MSRSGYVDDLDPWPLIKWRGQVTSALRGRRGQRLLRDLIAALDALPEKRLIEGAFEQDGEFCALGAAGRLRGIDLSDLYPDEEDAERVAERFDVAHQLVREVTFVNDEDGPPRETPERRFQRVRSWAVKQLLDASEPDSGESSDD